VQKQSTSFVLGSVVGGVGGLVIGATLAALFWNDIAAAFRKLMRHFFHRDEQVNFEILLQ
jgi:hypothetical protein